MAKDKVWPTEIPKDARYLNKPKGTWVFTNQKRDYVDYADGMGSRLVWTESGL